MGALSSRNAYLSAEERQVAPLLYNALKAAEKHIHTVLAQGDSMPSEAAVEAARQGMSDFVATLSDQVTEKVDIELDYFKLNDPMTLQPLASLQKGQAAVLSGAIKVGKTRLIDNLLINIAV